MKVKLKKIEIIGFKSSSKIAEVIFSDEDYTVIYGGNGSGKTTYLKLIHAIFSKDQLVLNENNVTEININYYYYEDGEEYSNKISIKSEINESHFVNYRNNSESLRPSEDLDYIEIKRNEKYIQFQTTSGHLIRQHIRDSYVSYDWEEYDNSHLKYVKSLFLGVERGVSTYTEKLSYKSLLNFVNKESISGYFSSNKHGVMFAKRLHRYISMGKNRNNDIRDYASEKHLNLQELNMDQIESFLLEMYFTTKHEISLKIQNALFQTLAVAIDRIEKRDVELYYELNNDFDFYNLFIENKNRIIEALESSYTGNEFSIKFIQKIKSIKTADDFFIVIKNDIFYSLIDNMIKETQQEKKLLSPVNALINMFNRYLNNKPFLAGENEFKNEEENYEDGKYISITNNKIKIITEGDRQSSHNINSLSSGEKHILVFLSMILMVGADRDFIFIDEPELSLNIIWVRELMETLKILAPSSQIIVASHSPILARNNPNALVELNVSKIEGREF